MKGLKNLNTLPARIKNTAVEKYRFYTKRVRGAALFYAHESFAACSQIQDYRGSTDSQSVGKLNFAEDETASFCISSLLKERRYSRMDGNSIVSF